MSDVFNFAGVQCNTCKAVTNCAKISGTNICQSCHEKPTSSTPVSTEVKKPKGTKPKVSNLGAGGNTTAPVAATCGKQHSAGKCGVPSVNGKGGDDARCLNCANVDFAKDAFSQRGLKFTKTTCHKDASHGPMVSDSGLCAKCQNTAMFEKGKAAVPAVTGVTTSAPDQYKVLFGECKVLLGWNAIDVIKGKDFKEKADTLWKNRVKTGEAVYKPADHDLAPKGAKIAKGDEDVYKPADHDLAPKGAKIVPNGHDTYDPSVYKLEVLSTDNLDL